MARRKKQFKRSVPLPEAIDGKRWQVHQAPTPRHAGMAHEGLVAKEGVLVVPMGTDQNERLVRMHEMVHVSITPREVVELADELPESIVQLCEDSRVHRQMARLGFEINEMQGVISDFEIKQMAEHSHPSKLAAAAAAMYGTGEIERLMAAITPPEGDADEEAWAEHDARINYATFGTELARQRMWEQADLPSFETTIRMARDIVDLLGDPNDPDPPPVSVPPSMLPYFAGMPVDESEGIEVKGGSDENHGEEGLWANMTLEEPPLPLKLPGKMRGRRKRVADVKGRRLHRIGRLHHDGKVFAHKPPLRGGAAVLIDTSGSMDLDPDQVLELCLKFPGGVIAAYSSDHDDTEGTLRVIARKGRRVVDDLIDPPGAGNGVDGPALDWLALQPGPRYWISDAGVSGGATGLRYCLGVCRKHKIERVDNAWELLDKIP